ncbi:MULTISPECIES: hypothetical protein [Streptomyces]|uniref:hypothetical protein n=1 Tax=Streptomyces TaxID=1883 RepID=UPI001D15CDCB|nr:MULTISPECIES: hypothetical protein [Streptomyces]MCC3655569.1 hypothetical protein [Streptomyces sp. S07_1.15]WSQ70114.1 hypothetical protein OG463_00865 [Streptomyces xinghaiensis]
MPAGLSSVIAATTRWLTRSYPAAGGALNAAYAEIQARQAVSVAAMLRYPTELDAGLLVLTGPGGSGRLDRLTGADAAEPDPEDHAWRTWVDEVLASWAACLLTDPALAGAAVAAVAEGEHPSGFPYRFRRLTEPDDGDRRAAPLLRHPDLLEPVALLHRAPLLERLHDGLAEAA